jgi:hypothetical protein
MSVVGFRSLWNRLYTVFKLPFYQGRMPFLVWFFALWNDRFLWDLDDDKMGRADCWEQSYAWKR